VSARLDNGMCIGYKCQYFSCTQHALKVVRRGNELISMCLLAKEPNGTYGPCIGYKCQYSLCNAHVMDPKGKCLLERERPKTLDLIKEANNLDKQYSKIKGHLKKMGMDDYI
jgi:hypothetical protein